MQSTSLRLLDLRTTMHLALLGFIGMWLLSWATFLGLKLLSRTQGQRHPLTLFDDSTIEL